MSYEDREAQIKELSDRKQAGIAKSVALNDAVELIAHTAPAFGSRKSLVKLVIETAREFEKYLKEV